MSNKVIVHSLFTDFDLGLFAFGTHLNLYQKFGSHLIELNGQAGTYFSVYAPAARKVQVIGNFNSWEGHQHDLFVKWDGSGIWEGFIPGIKENDLYKYRIFSNQDSIIRDKADPFARKYELPPKTASIVTHDNYEWKDDHWQNEVKAQKNNLSAPVSIYEIHLGSWKKKDGRSLHYTEMADELVAYLVNMKFTHVEFLPVMEHPYYPSWGYLSTGYFAPTSRFGTPDELKFLIDQLHRAEIGVILDWVPAHFPADEFALANFDGSQLYEHPDKAKGYHPDWNSLIFNYERPQIRSFLLSSANFWCREFHADGIRVDAVASMLYLDYSREDGQWTPNEFGNNEYLAAIEFIKELNSSLYKDFPQGLSIAEESTAFPGVTTPVNQNGLGFGLKWMMGWMNDTLEYFERNPIYRKYHHNDISRSLTYAFTENYILPLSHDEVVHGKQSLVYKMPGDEWQKFANLRLLYSYMFTHPGQKLIFMGCEFGQTSEWNVDDSLDWHLLEYDPHKGIQELVRDLNNVFKTEESLFELNYSNDGFEWIDFNDRVNTVLAYMRKSNAQHLVVVLNFSPVTHEAYKLGVPDSGAYLEIFNSDDVKYWGSGIINKDELKTSKEKAHERSNSLTLKLPPLGAIILKRK